MKKNNLIVQSLFVLPLLTAAPLLGMKTEQKQTDHNNTCEKPVTETTEVKHTISSITTQLMNDLKSSPSFLDDLKSSPFFVSQRHKATTTELPTMHLAPINNNNNNNQTEEIITNPLIKSEVETIDLPLPTYTRTNTNNSTTLVNQDLLQSVMMPTERAELTIFEKCSYWLSSNTTALQNVIEQLRNKTFNASDLTSIERFTAAVTTATNNKDIESLAIIADLCSKNYPQTIRIFDDAIAQQASGFLNTHYIAELSLANQTMQNNRQASIKQWTIETAACITAMSDLITSYNQKVQNIAAQYDASAEQENTHIRTLRTQVSTFALLHKESRENTATLLNNNKLEQPTNKFAKTMTTTESKLNSLAKIANEMPQIIVFPPKEPKNPILNLTK